MIKGKTHIQKYAYYYAILFFFVVALGYIPGLTINGHLLGLFDIDPIDDILHFASAVWAGVAAWHSRKASVFFFKAFGILYTLDGIVGVITGRGYLDLAIFTKEYLVEGFVERILVNIPHIAIGGLAIYIGFVLAKKIK
jgi:hypothetical protein